MRGRRVPFRTSDGRDGTVRVARNADARACLRIVAAIIRERPRTLLVLEHEIWGVREWKRHRIGWSPEGATLVAEVGGVLVGQLGVTRGPRPAVRHAAEFGITVARDYRGLGVGSALIEAAESWALEHDVSIMRLGVFVTNPRARALYERLGYVQDGVETRGARFPEGDIDVVRMHKDLARP
ncbi:MAG TPA: GNAT family N-acetyltransferase [Actinomycetota bacterium]